MGNCLKTQLRERVNNDNLPIFNKLIVKIKNAMASPATDSFYFNFWSPNPTEWSVSNGVHDGSGNPVQIVSPALAKSGRLDNVVGNTITINNPYAQKIVRLGRDITSDYATVNGIESLSYCTNLQLIQFTENWGDLDFTKLHNLVYYSCLASSGNPAVYSNKSYIESLLANNPKLIFLNVLLPSNDKLNISSLSPNLQIILPRITGNIINFPLVLEEANCGFADIIGSLDDYVAKIRTVGGKTSGAIHLSWLWNSGITIKGQSCQEYLITKGITTNPGSNTWLTWTASDLDIVTTNPGLTPISTNTIESNIIAGIYDD